MAVDREFRNVNEREREIERGKNDCGVR